MFYLLTSVHLVNQRPEGASCLGSGMRKEVL